MHGWIDASRCLLRNSQTEDLADCVYLGTDRVETAMGGVQSILRRACLLACPSWRRKRDRDRDLSENRSTASVP